MAKKSPALSRREGLTKMTSKDIKNRKWTEAERRLVKRHAAKQAAGDDSDINYDDIPRLTDAQLAQMVRLRDIRPKVPVSVRLDPSVLAWLRSKGEGHLTRINDILRNIMEDDMLDDCCGKVVTCYHADLSLSGEGVIVTRWSRLCKRCNDGLCPPTIRRDTL